MASTYLTRTPSSAGNRKTFTISAWFKKNPEGVQNIIYSNVSNESVYQFTTTGQINYYEYSGGYTSRLLTNALLRDSSAWYHIVLAVDTTQATSSNRLKMYVNGEQVTSFSAATYPSQNFESYNINNNSLQTIGANNGADCFNGSMTHFHFIDGTAYPASTFGEVDSTSGIWKPNTSPSVTYGTNGFFLKMENASAMGTDSSGNSNTFTVSGSLTKNQDTPNNNFATLNPLNAFYTNSTFSNGNTTFASGNSSTATVGNFLINTGKFYWEVKVISKSGGGDNYGIGIQGQDATAIDQFPGNQSTGWMYTAGGSYYTGGSGTSTGVTYTAGDIIGVALDCTNNKLYWSKNGTFILSGNPSAGTGGISITAPASVTLGGYYPSQTNWEATTSGTFSMNFGNGYFGTTPVSSAGTNASGNGIFEYDVPTGYTALSTKGLNS